MLQLDLFDLEDETPEMILPSLEDLINSKAVETAIVLQIGRASCRERVSVAV